MFYIQFYLSFNLKVRKYPNTFGCNLIFETLDNKKYYLSDDKFEDNKTMLTGQFNNIYDFAVANGYDSISFAPAFARNELKNAPITLKFIKNTLIHDIRRRLSRHSYKIIKFKELDCKYIPHKVIELQDICFSIVNEPASEVLMKSAKMDTIKSRNLNFYDIDSESNTVRFKVSDISNVNVTIYCWGIGKTDKDESSFIELGSIRVNGSDLEERVNIIL